MKRFPLSICLIVFFLFLLWNVSVRQSLLYLIGIGMGATLAGARFGFTTGWRQLAESKDPKGSAGQIVLLVVAASLSIPLLANYPELSAALGPPSISLLIGAFVFGISMQIADGCGSGSLYKAGMGIPLNLGILPLFAFGSFLGSVHLDQWLSLGQIEPINLIEEFGATSTVVLTWVLLGLTLFGIWLWSNKPKTLLDKRWVLGGVILAILATLNLIVAGQPWGVVYGFGLWAAKVSYGLGLFEPTANTFWGQEGNLTILTQSVLLDITSITNIGILSGALWISSLHNDSSKPLTNQQWLIGLLAGFAMGYSSRLAFGCNIGGMVSGISTGSVHGWIWVPMAFLGTLIGIRIRRYFKF
jgi:uncharacterized membrane protein YedE/YeeE